MKNTFYCSIVLLCLVAMGCSEKETPGGVKYRVHKKGDGVTPAFGQFMVLNMSLIDHKDSVWFSTTDFGNPVVVPVQDASMETDEGENGVFKQLTKGDSVSFQLSAKTIFTKTRRANVPKNVDPLSLFKFNVGLKDIWTKEQVDDFQKKIMVEGQANQIKKDSTTIGNYLKEKGLDALATRSGLRYLVKKEGTGAIGQAGKTAYVHYAGFLLNGKMFDTSLAAIAKENNFDNGGKNEPYPVVINTAGVIAGWDEMLMLMNKGMKVTVFVPSHLGYGGPGSGLIPPNSVMMFDMEVMDIK